jgi:hypothetical protein
MLVGTYSTKPPYLICGAPMPPSNTIRIMAKPTSKPNPSIYDLLRTTANSSNEELVVLNADNAKSVAKKDRIIALLCEDYQVVPTFTAKEYNGTKYITVSQETVTSLMNAILA